MFARSLFSRVIPLAPEIIKAARVLNAQAQQVSLPHIALCKKVPNVLVPRFYSQEATSEVMTADYDYVKKATTNNDVLIIDVREPDEIKEHGKIPNSINIPLGSVSSVFTSMSEKEFQNIYNRPKPKENSEVIFYCMIGKRSGKAQREAIKAGYKNVKNYLGSWTEWASKQ
ncbi:rhodanese domain-containing protein CG4456-like [Manduca sexta]|uniref:LOW QUALITY PROTEIN: rhodanese domain-containing protein CG4456 n=1 Tax=Manduca sexta TaxID=7130 RepID=UPI001184622A|nr:LOW QUALITY PROTEIN: rhodanese domain-containing protein CG4456 [Manduca sexta]XP_037296504.1 rhodanese domain-containing protein CG4456-like [Manduca sexta]